LRVILRRISAAVFE